MALHLGGLWPSISVNNVIAPIPTIDQNAQDFIDSNPDKTVYVVPSDPQNVMVAMAHLSDYSAKISNGWSGFWPQFAQIQSVVEGQQPQNLCEFLNSHDVDGVLNIQTGVYRDCGADKGASGTRQNGAAKWKVIFSFQGNFWRYLPDLKNARAQNLNGYSYGTPSFAFSEGHVFRLINPLNCANEVEVALAKDDLGSGYFVIKSDGGEPLRGYDGLFKSEDGVFPAVIQLERTNETGSKLPLRIGISSITFRCV